MEKTMTVQEKLIGQHPQTSFFYEWLESDDLPVSVNQKHRQLSEIAGTREYAVEQISDWIIKHHIDDERINRLKSRRKKILEKYGLEDYLKKQEMIPTAEKTIRGNTGEIILAEYLQAVSELKLLVYRLRYNPNVNQSMKGDDVLLFNEVDVFEKIIVGESKFRKTPGESTIKDIMKEFGHKLKLPLSVLFVAQKLSDLGQQELAGQLEELNIDLYDGRIPIVNVGFLLSNHNTAANVKKHLNTKNPNFVFISLGIEKPEELITKSFELAKQKLKKVIENE